MQRIVKLSVILGILFLLPTPSRAQLWSGLLNTCTGTAAATLTSPQRCGNPDWQNAGVVGGIPSATWTQSGATIAAGASTATIQSALNACGTNHFVLLGPGTFSSITHLTIPSNCVLRGSGTLLWKANQCRSCR